MEKTVIDRRVAGLVLFTRNVADGGQLTSLCNELQRLRRRAGEPPLIIAVDHEGGYINRLGACATRFPSQMAVAATGRVDYAKWVGRCMGQQLLSLGINMNFAPVLDLITNSENSVVGVRSFGDNPEGVAAFGAAMIEGLQGAGVACVAKHFPGLGSASRDTHIELPVITREMEDLEREELVPFNKAVEAGVYGLMVGHANYAALSAMPASLSHEVINGLLRGRLGFDGVAVTDDLEMGAISDRQKIGDAVVRACVAGADLLLVCHSKAKQLEAMRVLDKVRSGSSRERLNRLYSFIEKAVKRRDETKEKITEEAEELARKIAEEAVTVVGDTKGILPIRIGEDDRLLLILPELGPLTAAEDEAGTVRGLLDFVRMRHAKTEAINFELVPSSESFKKIIVAVSDARVVLMATCNAHLYSEQARLVREVAGAGKPTIFVGLRDPYDIKIYPPDSARLAAYGSVRCTLAAISRIIFGEIEPRGQLPVKLS